MRFPRVVSIVLLLLLLGLNPACLRGQSAGPSVADRAYAALAQGDLSTAIATFQQAVEATPDNASLRKDYAYTLLKTGDTSAARDQFGEALRLDPADTYAALEYAFLCHETGKQGEAWRIFRNLRSATNPEHQQTARRTFDNLDAELTAQIQRLNSALARNPADDGSHLEVAKLHMIRNDFPKAAAHFEQAYRIKPQYPEWLLLLAEAAKQGGDVEKSKAAILLASRSPSAFVAEQAKPLLPDRYPYLYEFESALALCPASESQSRKLSIYHSDKLFAASATDSAALALRREMAFFLVTLGRGDDAIQQFQRVVAQNPTDLIAAAQLGFLLKESGDGEQADTFLRAALSTSDLDLRQRVRRSLGLPDDEADRAAAATTQAGISSTPLAPPVALPQPAVVLAEGAAEAKQMAAKSYDSGYIPDAIRYYQQAHELDPTDFDTMLKLGYSLNMGRRDQEALQWFFLAARSPDIQISSQAKSALKNLTTPAPSGAAMAAIQPASESPASRAITTSVWAMPMHSTRWGSTFAYSQAKAELNLPDWKLVPYLSLRFVGDTTGSVGGANPQFLSENAFILGAGLRSKVKHGVLAWAEAGSAMAYLGQQREQTAAFAPDYRGGISQFKLFGPSMLADRPGWFTETMNDLVYIHRFDRDTLAISRNRIGRHFGGQQALGGLQAQLFLNLNANADFKRQAWASFFEAGPGFRLRWKDLPPSMSFTFNVLRGFHPISRIDGRPNTYTDFQAGFWYAYSR